MRLTLLHTHEDLPLLLDWDSEKFTCCTKLILPDCRHLFCWPAIDLSLSGSKPQAINAREESPHETSLSRIKCQAPNVDILNLFLGQQLLDRAAANTQSVMSIAPLQQRTPLQHSRSNIPRIVPWARQHFRKSLAFERSMIAIVQRLCPWHLFHGRTWILPAACRMCCFQAYMYHLVLWADP